MRAVPEAEEGPLQGKQAERRGLRRRLPGVPQRRLRRQGERDELRRGLPGMPRRRLRHQSEQRDLQWHGPLPERDMHAGAGVQAVPGRVHPGGRRGVL